MKHGHGGWTMKDFMDGKESYHKCSWESIKTQFATGDYVIIALGTNDTSQISAYNKNPEKGYSAEQFKNWYKEIAADVKAKGAHLIVLTPPAAAYTVKDGKFIGTDEWAATQALFELRDEVDGITVIDMGNTLADQLNEYIDNQTYTLEDMVVQQEDGKAVGPGAIFVDTVHFSEEGAMLMAKLIVEQIEASSTGLEEYIVRK